MPFMPIKFRYQNKKFRESLNEARRYERKKRHIPSTGREIFLSKIGLESWPAKVALILAVAALIYATYIPNFLFVRQIKINGLKLEERNQVESAVLSYISSRSFWPKKNMLLLNSAGLKRDVLEKFLNISNVESVEKDYPGNLVINLNPRYGSYYTQANLNAYTISSDGLVLEIRPAAEPVQGSLTQLQFESTADWAVGQKVINNDTQALLSAIKKSFSKGQNIGINSIKLQGKEQEDLEVDTRAGYLLKLSLQSDFSDVVRNLNSLLGQISRNDQGRLAYIDLRVPERAYVCYKGTTCAAGHLQEIAGNSTSTPAHEILKP